MTRDTISIDELEPLVEMVEIIASALDEFLRGFNDPWGPLGVKTCKTLTDEIRAAPDLREWLNELRRNETM